MNAKDNIIATGGFPDSLVSNNYRCIHQNNSKTFKYNNVNLA